MGTEHHSDGSNNLDVLDEDEKDEDSGNMALHQCQLPRAYHHLKLET